jgi:hypothetical protein
MAIHRQRSDRLLLQAFRQQGADEDAVLVLDIPLFFDKTA